MHLQASPYQRRTGSGIQGEGQLAMGEEAIAEEDRWMLEVDVAQLRDSNLEEQQY